MQIVRDSYQAKNIKMIWRFLLQLSGAWRRRRIATETAEWALTKRISRAIVYSLSKKGLGWRPEEVSRSQSSESLSLFADDWAAALDMARTRFQDRVGVEIPTTVAGLVAA
jgi:hypothetical protein